MSSSRFHLNRSAELQLGFSQAATAGEFLFVSGTVALNRDFQPLHIGDWAAQCRSIYESLQVTLNAHELTFSSVVKETIFTRDLKAFFEHANPVRMSFYPNDSFPAATAVKVAEMAFEENLMEIELVALYSQTKRN